MMASYRFALKRTLLEMVALSKSMRVLGFRV